MTSISSQSSAGSGKSRRFFRLKFSLPVSSASLKHLSSGMFPDMVGFTCYKEDIGALSRRLFRRLGDILEISRLVLLLRMTVVLLPGASARKISMIFFCILLFLFFLVLVVHPGISCRSHKKARHEEQLSHRLLGCVNLVSKLYKKSKRKADSTATGE